MEIIKVSENSKLIRVKLGDIKPNRFRDLERWPVEREVIDGLKDSIQKEGFWSKSIQAVINEQNEVELRFGHHRLTAAIEMFGSDYETEIDLVEFRGELSQQRAMRLENSVRRNMNKTNNELVYQCMHWFDDRVFADYPTWEDVNRSGIFTIADLEEFFGDGASGPGKYTQCVESGIGRNNIAKFTTLNENEVKESLASLPTTERRKRGMEKRAERDRKIAEEKRAEEARLKAERDEADRIRREEAAEAARIRKEIDDEIKKKERQAKQAKDALEREAKKAEQAELERIRAENAVKEREKSEKRQRDELERQQRAQNLEAERKKAEKGAKVVEVSEWYDARASEVFDLPAHGKAFREEVSKDEIRKHLQSEMLVPFAQAIKIRLEVDTKTLGRQMMTDSNIRSSVHEFFVEFKNTMKIREREVQAKEEKDNPLLEIKRLMDETTTAANRYGICAAKLDAAMKKHSVTALNGIGVFEFLEATGNVNRWSTSFMSRGNASEECEGNGDLDRKQLQSL